MVAPTRLTKVTDLQLVKLFNELHDDFHFSRIYVYFGGGASTLYQGAIDRADFEARSQLVCAIQAFMPNGQSRILFARGEYTADQNNVDVNRFINCRKSALFDEYWLGGDGFTVEQAQEIFRKFSAFRFLELGASDSGGSVVDLLTSHVEQLRELQLDFHQRQLAADEELRMRRAALEAESNESLSRTRQQLEDERAQLEQRRQELNDREPQHERRRLREDLTRNIGKILKGESGNIESKHRSHLFFLLAGALLISVSIALTIQYSVAGDAGQQQDAFRSFPFWITALKGFAAGAAGVALLWAGLSAMKKAEEAERAQSARLQRYSHDMDRASWVVETILQLSSTESAKVPDVWLESVCNGLFSSEPEKSSSSPDSLEALGALLDATARAKIGTNGFEFELDHRGAKKVASQVQ